MCRPGAAVRMVAGGAKGSVPVSRGWGLSIDRVGSTVVIQSFGSGPFV